MAESEEPKSTCTFLFKKSTKKFSARKRKASDSEKGTQIFEENRTADFWFIKLYNSSPVSLRANVMTYYGI